MTTHGKNIDTAWIDTQINAFTDVHPSYVLYAKTLRVLLQEMAEKYDSTAIVQTRPKSITSFAEKIVRKWPKYHDPLNQLTDLCGGRIITHTQRQVRDICKLIEEHFLIDWDNSVDVKQRLKPSEFGYLSVHYIIQFKPDDSLQKKYGIEIPEEANGLKAEIQVRTILEHAWANLYHEWVYKNEVDVPNKLQREMAGIAARLEAADNSFSGVQEDLRNYYTSYGPYMDSELLLKEIEKLEITLKYDPENLSLLRQLGRMVFAIEDWDKAIKLLSPFETKHDPVLLRILGTALCKKYKSNPNSQEYKKGQEHLLEAGSPPHNNPDALASLAGSWKGIDNSKSNEYYQKAYELDPTDAYPLGNYLEGEIIKDKNLSIIGFTKPVLKDAIQRSKSCIEVDVNIPWAYYDVGKLELLLKEPYTSFSAYAKAMDLSTAAFMVETSFDSLKSLSVVKEHIPGYKWIENLFCLGFAARFGNESAKAEIQVKASAGNDKIDPACVILVGGSCDEVQEKIEGYGPMLEEAFNGFMGTIISGGTKAGISKIAGDLKMAYPDDIQSIGYAPAPKKAHFDTDKQRYNAIRTTDGDDFSPLEATQYWMDIMASGINPESVKLLVMNGGEISSAECKLALILGAQVGIVEGSGGEPSKLFTDSAWNHSKTLIQLPDDPAIIHSFISSGPSKMDDRHREILAREIHEQYLETSKKKPDTKDPSLENWDDLNASLKHSNLCQADQIFEKLKLLGYAVRDVTGRTIKIHKFAHEEVEQMAEQEHARWVVERLAEGWKPAPEKDVNKKLSPYLVSWKYLSEEIRDYDRETVRHIPAYLVKVGLEVYPLP